MKKNVIVLLVGLAERRTGGTDRDRSLKLLMGTEVAELDLGVHCCTKYSIEHLLPSGHGRKDHAALARVHRERLTRAGVDRRAGTAKSCG
jgi:hypothetical protein